MPPKPMTALVLVVTTAPKYEPMTVLLEIVPVAKHGDPENVTVPESEYSPAEFGPAWVRVDDTLIDPPDVDMKVPV